MLQPDLILAEMSVLPYYDPNFYCGNVQARIIRRNGITYINPAGSNDFTDWRQNLFHPLVPRCDGKYRLFKGFADMAEQTRDTFRAYIAPFPGPWVIGAHSAGCDVGFRWADWMCDWGQKPQFVQMLAAPCVGDLDWASHWNSREIPTLRIGLNHDPVSEAYKSCGGVPECETLYLNRDGVVVPRKSEDLALFTEHPSGHYLRAIRCYLGAG